MSNKALELFNPTCKDGAKWYACEATASNKSPFVGCCKTDPCSISGCALGNLAPVSFNASAYGTLPDPTCGAASTFYSCVNIPSNTTTFWGCCKSNACNHENEPDNKSCPTEDLTGAVLDTASLQSAYSIDGQSDSSASSSSSSNHVNIGVIVGAAVGGFVAVVAIIALLIFLLKRRRNKSRPSSPSSNGPGREKTEYRHSAYSEAPPLYTSPKPPPFAFNNNHAYTPVAQSGEPQELPAEINPIHAASPQPNTYSELPAEGAGAGVRRAPVELESPMVSPAPFASPRHSPRVPQGGGPGVGMAR